MDAGRGATALRGALLSTAVGALLLLTGCTSGPSGADDTESGAHGSAESGKLRAGGAARGEAQAGDAPAGEPSAGDAPAGEAPAGEAPAGEAMAGASAAGEPSAGEAAPGGTAPGAGASGGAARGEAPAGETSAGEAGSGEAPAGEAMAGASAAGEPSAGEAALGGTAPGAGTTGGAARGEAPAGETSAGQAQAGESPDGEAQAGETPARQAPVGQGAVGPGGGQGGTAVDGPFWADPGSPAARQLAVYEGEGRAAEAAAVRRIAGRATGEWLGGAEPEARARAVTEAAARAGRIPLLVLYDIPYRDCGQYSRGGAPDGAAYRAWTAAVARGIADRPALVVVEPDALLHLVDGCTPAALREERYALLADAVTTLKSLENTKVYLDAGNAGRGRTEGMDRALLRAGVARADGFAVNVANFYSTGDSLAYGRQLSAAVGGKHFVVDTSRNGNGPYREGDPAKRWCNPPGRALGTPPTTRTADPLVDAYLWVKTPGESDGECKGGPKAGRWWPEYALGLTR